LSDELAGARERVTRYRAFEKAALSRADETKQRHLRGSYLTLAKAWADLANRLEGTIQSRGNSARDN
jgi:hypothetical protein